jgi:hypothetical protein
MTGSPKNDSLWVYIEILGRTFYFAADSNNLEEGIYEYIRDSMGPIDNVFIGMECIGGPLDWIYGPLLSNKINYQQRQSRRYSGSDSTKALKIVSKLGAKNAYVYAMGQEPWLTHITSLNYDANSKQIQESEVFINICLQNNIKARRLYGRDEWFYKPVKDTYLRPLYL